MTDITRIEHPLAAPPDPGWVHKSPNGILRCAAYLRVSSDEQHPENQKTDIEALAHSRGWQISEWIEESESAWKAGHQHALANLFKNLRDGNKRYDYLIVWSLDRLTREGTIKQFVYLHVLSQYKCTLISVKEPWVETNDLTRDLMLSITSYMAKAESQRRSDRVRAGIARKAANSTWKPGRQKGAKDKPGKPRRRAGYLRRYVRDANKLAASNETEILSVGTLTK